mmetsp:Transcript_72823/g.115262  ORF Transcript_72823/g.115262 Transcript_72823/m.115262 type:complete len:170 (-) Transcript_72823:91-600(-)
MGQQCCASQENTTEAVQIDPSPVIPLDPTPVKEEPPKEEVKEEEVKKEPEPVPVVEEPPKVEEPPPPKVEEKVEEPPAEPPVDNRVTVEFDINGQLKEYEFTKRPLGLTFANKDPLCVQKVVPKSHAEELGIQAGWKFNKICGKPVKGQEWKTLVANFHDKAKTLPEAK